VVLISAQGKFYLYIFTFIIIIIIIIIFHNMRIQLILISERLQHSNKIVTYLLHTRCLDCMRHNFERVSFWFGRTVHSFCYLMHSQQNCFSLRKTAHLDPFFEVKLTLLYNV